MKVLFTLLVMVFALGVNAQNKPAAAAPKPKAGPPYILKKDFEEAMAAMKSHVSSVSGANASLRSSIAAKDARISELDSQLRQVVEVMNSANFKIATTSDSLSQTRGSVEEVKRNSDARFAVVEEAAAQTMMILWIALGLALVLPILVWIIMASKIGKAKAQVTSQLIEMESKVDRHLQRSEEKLNSGLEEGKRTIAAASNEVSNQTSFMERKLSYVNSDIEELKEKISLLMPDKPAEEDPNDTGA